MVAEKAGAINTLPIMGTIFSLLYSMLAAISHEC